MRHYSYAIVIIVKTSLTNPPLSLILIFFFFLFVIIIIIIIFLFFFRRSICERYLQQSSAKILYWAPEDEQLSPAIGVPGAPLKEAGKLHLDIQQKYKKIKT